jgi:L-arabinokinase
VRQPTSHPIHEHARVREFAELLATSPTEPTLERLGALMYESHASYSACGLGEQGTDRLVALVREAGAQHGLYGAKITGGGSGGTVAVLGRRGADIERVASAYARETGRPPRIFSGSSPGAAVFGHIRLRSVDGPGS